MRDLTPNELGVMLFNIKGDLEIIASTLSNWRMKGLGQNGMVPLSVIAAETKINATITEVEDLIQILAKVSNNLFDRY
jgi:hypothetical protein